MILPTPLDFDTRKWMSELFTDFRISSIRKLVKLPRTEMEIKILFL